MFNQVGSFKFSSDGLMKKGVIVRHLMLPSLLFDSKKIIDYLYSKFNDSIYISIMNQYTLTPNIYKYPELNKPLNNKHYSALVDYCISLGVKNAFIQDIGTSSDDFIPTFNLSGI